MKYLVPIPDQLSDDDVLDSEELAVALGHINEDAATELLEVHDTRSREDYVLRLCGTVKLKDPQGRVYLASDLTVSQFRELRDSGEFLTNSWFEWIRADGDAILEPMENICSEADKEISMFAEWIGVDAAVLEAKTPSLASVEKLVE